MLSNVNYSDLISKYKFERDPFVMNLSAKLDESIIFDKKLRTLRPNEHQETKRKFHDRGSVK